MDAKLKHLEFIQDTINRMAKNSFLLKGWAVTVVGGLLALGFKDASCTYLAYVMVSMIVLTFFWMLDSYYLYQEKLFIELYNQVREKPEQMIDFSMRTSEFKGKVSWFGCGISNTISIFYSGLILVHLIIILIA